MLSLSVDLAIFKRLTGAPLDSQGRPVVDAEQVPVNRNLVGPVRLNGERQPSYGVRIPVALPEVREFDLNTTSPETRKIHADGFYTDVFKQVTVYWEGTSGRDWNVITPCVVFGDTGIQATNMFVHYDDFVLPDPDAGTMTLESGEVVPAGFLVSPHPEQRIITYAIKVFARTKVEMSLICDQVERLFPTRGAIFVELANNTEVAYDMTRYGEDNLSYRPDDKDRSLFGDERFYGKAFLYRVEAYHDYTLRAFGDQFSQQHEAAILSYVMELVDKQTPTLVMDIEEVTATPLQLQPIGDKRCPVRKTRSQPSLLLRLW